MFLQNPKRSQNFPAVSTKAEPNCSNLSTSPDRGGGDLQGPMMKAEKSGPVGSSWPQDQPGTSSEAMKEVHQYPAASQQSSQGSLAPLPKKRSYSMEMFSTWRDIRWFQIPLSSLRRPKAGLFSFTFQSSLQEYQQLRKSKRLKVGRPFSVLPLPGLPSTLDDCPQEAPHKRNDSRRCLRARKARGSKSLSSHKKGHQASGGLNTRLRKCLSTTNLLPKSYIFCSKTPQGEKKQPSGCSGKKWKKGLAPSRFLPACPTEETDASGDQFEILDGTRSLLEEDDGFSPDWTPPPVDFMYDNPPSLSPAPGSLSESQSSGEMPDITEGLDELSPRECATEASAATEGHLLFLEESVAMQDEEHESGEVRSPDCPSSNFCPERNEKEEGDMFENQSLADDQMALEEHPSLPSPVHPLPVVHFRSSISTTSEEFSRAPEGLVYESDAVEEESGPGYPTASPPAFIPMTSSRMSCEHSVSASMDELSNDSEGWTQASDMEGDSDDRDLLPLEELLWTSKTNSSAVETKTTFLSTEQDCFLSNLDKLLEEIREQTWEEEALERSVGQKLQVSRSPSSTEVAKENQAFQFSEAHGLILEKFTMNRGCIAAVHPGENIFGFAPYSRTALALDITGLKPQNKLEGLFFRSSFDRQMVLLKDGVLRALYRGPSKCPHAVLHWLFQLMTLNPGVSASAFHALWEISIDQVALADKGDIDLWCPMLKDIAQAFYSLGASASTLDPAGLFQPEFGLQDSEFPDAGIKREIIEEVPSPFVLAATLGNVCKFLTLCAVSHPHRYLDQERLALLTLLCRVGLDRNLCKQPNVDLQQLLLFLLEGVQDWPGKLPELCESLCHVSLHHHNMVAVMRSFPDTTPRGRQLRRNLSLCFVTKLLGKTQMVRRLLQKENQLEQLGHLLPLMKPAALKKGLQKELSLPEPPGRGQLEGLAELDQEACYLCYSLLTLANAIVTNQAVPSRHQGTISQLCIQLQQYISSTVREDSRLMYRTQLKDLAARTYIKWQGLLTQSWLQTTLPEGPE